jgi:hypothetical protein
MIVSRNHVLALYLIVQAAIVLTIAFVPGDPNYGEHREYLGGTVVFDLLLAYGLYKRSRFVWGASGVLTLWGFLLYSLAPIYALAMLSPRELQPKVVAVLVLMAVQIAVLYRRELRPPPPQPRLPSRPASRQPGEHQTLLSGRH